MTVNGENFEKEERKRRKDLISTLARRVDNMDKNEK